MKVKPLAAELGVKPVELLNNIHDIAPDADATTVLTDEQTVQVRARYGQAEAEPAVTGDELIAAIEAGLTVDITRSVRTQAVTAEVDRLINVYLNQQQLPENERLALLVREAADLRKKTLSLAGEPLTITIEDGQVQVPSIAMPAVPMRPAPPLSEFEASPSGGSPALKSAEPK